MKKVVPRELAHRDVEEALEHYLVDATAKIALGFVDALEKAYEQRDIPTWMNEA